MEYIFGTNDYTGKETLKTKGDAHTNLTGFCQTVREYEDSTITDSFRVVEKTGSSEDAEGNCYDWYIIDSHNRNNDKTKRVQAQATSNTSAIDEILLKMLEG